MSEPSEQPERLNEQQAAAFLNSPPRTLQDWRSKRKGPPFYRLEGKIFYKKSDLIAWLESNRVEPEGSGTEIVDITNLKTRTLPGGFTKVLSDIQNNEPVPCGDCNACCKMQSEVDLYPHEVKKYKSGKSKNNPFTKSGYQLQKKHGSNECVYLLNGKCSIYESRPFVCRVFDCRSTALSGALEVDLITQPKYRQFVIKNETTEDKLKQIACRAAANSVSHEEFMSGASQIAYLAISRMHLYMPLAEKILELEGMARIDELQGLQRGLFTVGKREAS